MRRPVVFVFLTVSALALMGCDSGSSGSWGKSGESSGGSERTTTSDDLAGCLEGTWELDEAVLTSVFKAGFVEGMSETDGVQADIDTLTASQTVTFDSDETFTSATTMNGSLTATAQGQQLPIDMVIEATSSGTWETDGDKLAITTLEGGGTWTITLMDQTQTDDLGQDAGDVVMLPSTAEAVTCAGDKLTLDATGMSMLVPDAPDEIVFTRQ